jgi:FtsZ-interacting cell division protein YlmF
LADPGTVEGKRAQQAVVKKAGENPKLKTSALLEEFEAKTDDPSYRTRTITTKSLARQVQRAKAKAVFKPATPKTFDDLEDIPEEFKVER